MKKYIRADVDTTDIKVLTLEIKEAIETNLNNIYTYVNRDKEANKESIDICIKNINDNIANLTSILHTN